MGKTWSDRRIDRNRVLGTTFLAKSRNSRDLGVPGVSLGEALGGISGEKFRGEKNDEKKEVKVVASHLPRRDTRTLVRRDLGREFITHDLARLRSSFGWAGGLFALRVSRRGVWRL